MESRIEMPSSTNKPSNVTPTACLPCRSVKMKCSPSGDGPRCERCTRKSLDCVFQEHRRGRKVGTRISKKPKGIKVSSTSPVYTAAAEDGSIVVAQPVDTPPSEAVELSPGWEAANLQPSGLLNHAIVHGKFSLRNVLSTTGNDAVELPDETVSIPLDDPVRTGRVNLSIAESLFKNFIDVLNPYISQLDPKLHSLRYVRQKSSFLFTAILAVAAKAFNPSMYGILQEHAETLLADTFRYGKKSTEIVQAVLIMTYWKEPEDTRAWTSLGYVIRIGMDLGWHKLAPYSAHANIANNETLKRETRNVQRTWYLMFVYDRSMSMQTGKPWMIERNAFIESIAAWCKDEMATSGDRLLGAFVTLRLLSSEVFKLLGPTANGTRGAPLHSFESLLAILKARIEEWEHTWIRYVDTGEESCHPFLIKFYGTHLRLQLYSLPLQEILTSKDPNISSDLEVLWVSYLSAMEMLQLICRSASWLYFAQDSIHVMTAYSATFLIKLLLSTPRSITTEIEPKITSTIREAAAVFSSQASPPGSSCTLQARFLSNLVSNYEKRRGQLESSENPTSTGNPINREDICPEAGASVATPSLNHLGLGQTVVEADGLSALGGNALQHAENIAGGDFWSDIFDSAGFSIHNGANWL